jgi:Tol biopolymer transport system component
MALVAGSRLGPYEIVAPLGAGGMGEVYRARDPRLNRDVAIKVLPSSFAYDTDSLRRFEQEAKAAGVLNHPNITAVYDVGTSSADGSPYVVQELLEGETLRGALAGGRLSSRRAVEYAIGIARGLAAAHEKGIVHRDLKPENLFVTHDGQVKILDFGLAKLTEPAGTVDQTGLPTATRGTEPGVVLGTLGYMSPEQVRGRPADHRSDIFAFGAILYEMLSGRRAFQGDSAADTMSAILKEDPPDLSVTNQQVSPALDRIVRHCLEKSPERRLHSSHDLAFELEALSQTSGAAAAVGASPSRARQYRRAALLLAGLAALAGAFLAGRRAAGSHAAPPTHKTFRRLTTFGGGEYSPALSADGELLAFTRRNGNKGDVWIQRTSGQKATNLTPDCGEDSSGPAFSPDGSQIAYSSQCGGGGLFLVGASGENTRRLTSDGADPAWSPDGREIVYATEAVLSPYGRSTTSELWKLDVANGKKRKLETGGDAVQPSISPGKKRIAYWGILGAGSQRDIWTIPYEGLAAGEQRVAVTHDDAVDWNPVWAPDGRSLYFLSNRDGAMNLYRVEIDEASGRVLGEPHAETLPAREVTGFSRSRDGRRIAYVADEWTYALQRFELDPSNGRLKAAPAEILRTTREAVLGPEGVSPDGQWIVFDTAGGAREDLVLIHPDGTGMRQLTDDPARDRFPVFFQDGRRVLFQSDRGGSWQVYSIAVDGSDLKPLPGVPDGTTSVILSPDGKRLAGAAKTGATVLFEVGEGGALREANLPSPPDGMGSYALGWTHDAHLIVGLVKPGGYATLGLAVYSFDEHRWERLARPPSLAITGGMFEVGGFYVLPTWDGIFVSTGDGKTWISFGEGTYFGAARAPDGRSFYAVKGETNADIWEARLAP